LGERTQCEIQKMSVVGTIVANLMMETKQFVSGTKSGADQFSAFTKHIDREAGRMLSTSDKIKKSFDLQSLGKDFVSGLGFGKFLALGTGIGAVSAGIETVTDLLRNGEDATAGFAKEVNTLVNSLKSLAGIKTVGELKNDVLSKEQRIADVNSKISEQAAKTTARNVAKLNAGKTPRQKQIDDLKAELKQRQLLFDKARDNSDLKASLDSQLNANLVKQGYDPKLSPLTKQYLKATLGDKFQDSALSAQGSAVSGLILAKKLRDETASKLSKLTNSASAGDIGRGLSDAANPIIKQTKNEFHQLWGVLQNGNNILKQTQFNVEQWHSKVMKRNEIEKSVQLPLETFKKQVDEIVSQQRELGFDNETRNRMLAKARAQLGSGENFTPVISSAMTRGSVEATNAVLEYQLRNNKTNDWQELIKIGKDDLKKADDMIDAIKAIPKNMPQPKVHNG
jgi:hypothetical protein